MELTIHNLNGILRKKGYRVSYDAVVDTYNLHNGKEVIYSSGFVTDILDYVKKEIL